MLAALLLVLTTAAANECGAPAPENEALRHHDGPMEKVLAEAKEKGRPVLIDFYTDWCGWCKVMDKEVFGDAEVAGFCNGNYVLYRVNAEKGEGVELKGKHEVDGFPTFVILDAGGKEIERQVGYAPKSDFLPLLQDVRAGRTFDALPGMIEKAPEDGALRVAYGKKLLSREKIAEAKEQFEKAVALDAKDGKPHTIEARLQLALVQSDEDSSLKPVREFLAKYPASSQAVTAHKMLLRHCLGESDFDGALESFAFLEGKGALAPQERCHYAYVLATEKKDGAKALLLADAVIKSNPEEVFGPMARAFALSALGRHDEAVEQAKKALEKAPPELREEGQKFVDQIAAARDEAKKAPAPEKPAEEPK